MPEDAKQSSAGAIEFIEYHKPGLTDGDYEIVVTQVLSAADKIPGDDTSTFTTKKNFTVAGERFDLKPSDIHAVFPPDGNLGEHSNVLPHIILNRSTLPWERRAEASSDLPWLALLLFDESEKPVPRLAHLTLADPPTITLEPSIVPPTATLEPSTVPPTAGTFPRFLAKGVRPDSSEGSFLELESGQNDGDKLTVIDVKKSLLEAIMPTANDLPFLAHVRRGKDPTDNPTGEELAVIISNRLPQPGKKSTMHLVSIEGRFKKVSASYEFDYEDDLIRLVSLKSWSFTCEDPNKSFKGLLLNLNNQGTLPSTLRLPESVNATKNAQAETFLSKGYVLLPHYFRHGDKTASWYHGPLVPGENTAAEISLPIRTADELVRYDPAIGMFDVSYASAWELGRLLSLQSKGFSTSLYQWKRLHAQQLAQVDQQLSHLPFQKTATTEAPPLPEAISSWLERLRNLEGIPFNYLVPDERLLPVESIRFFRVDNAWVGCLLDGAFSIGRVTTADHDRDKSQNGLAANPAQVVTGFLLRSEVVSGWPGLLVDAYSDREGKLPIRLLRMERLSANVLICLFEGEMKRVEIHQKPETVHFGLDVHEPPEDPSSGFYKNLRDATSGKQSTDRVEMGALPKDNVEIGTSHWRSGSPATLDISGLAQAIKLKVSTPFTSAQFALQMVEGVEKVVFLAGPTVNQPKTASH